MLLPIAATMSVLLPVLKMIHLSVRYLPALGWYVCAYCISGQPEPPSTPSCVPFQLISFVCFFCCLVCFMICGLVLFYFCHGSTKHTRSLSDRTCFSLWFLSKMLWSWRENLCMQLDRRVWITTLCGLFSFSFVWRVEGKEMEREIYEACYVQLLLKCFAGLLVLFVCLFTCSRAIYY